MGTQPLPKKGAEPPVFGLRLLWPNGCRYQDALGMEIGLGLRDIVLDEDPATPTLNGQYSPPNFRSMSVVAKRLDGVGLLYFLESKPLASISTIRSDPRPIFEARLLFEEIRSIRCHLVLR